MCSAESEGSAGVWDNLKGFVYVNIDEIILYNTREKKVHLNIIVASMVGIAIEKMGFTDIGVPRNTKPFFLRVPRS